ncbi:MAG: PD40 domain-containing protein [Haliscomenobacter sp.]|nr:PD40 domain-containing protein [Haliscomenobacter sp.]
MNNLLNSAFNEGMSTLVRNGRHMYFTACNRPEVRGPCDIWEADLEKEEIKRVAALEGNPNTDQWESQAAISCDGSTLFFASNRPEGQGGTDIWTSNKLPGGEWSNPVNLGPQINTPLDEEAPFISNDGTALYFSSTGHLGIGDQDIFVSFKDQHGNWTTPMNLGPKINTPHRELGFYLSADGKTGYFASDRPGGGGMDIYRVELYEELYSQPITYTEFQVRNSRTGEPIATRVAFGDDRQPLHTDSSGRFFCACPPTPISGSKLTLRNSTPSTPSSRSRNGTTGSSMPWNSSSCRFIFPLFRRRKPPRPIPSRRRPASGPWSATRSPCFSNLTATRWNSTNWKNYRTLPPASPERTSSMSISTAMPTI